MKSTSLLSNITIATRLMIGFGILVLIIAGLSSYLFYVATDARTLFADVVRLDRNETLSQRALRRVQEGRAATWVALAINDEASWRAAENAFANAGQRIEELAGQTRIAEQLTALASLRAQVADYQAKTVKLREFKGKNAALGTPEGRAAANSAMTKDSLRPKFRASESASLIRQAATRS